MTQFEDYFIDKILSGRSDFWGGDVGAPGGQAVSGVTFSNGNKTMLIAGAASGVGAYLKRTFSTTIFPDRTGGDNVWFRLLLTEGKIGLYEETISISVLSGAIDVTPPLSSIVTRAFSANPAYIEVIIPYTLQANPENMEIRLVVKPVSPVPTASRTITWDSFYVFNRTDGYTVAIDKVEKGVANSDYLYTFFERSAVMSKAVDNDSTDNTERLQAEIYNAVATSGELIFLQKGAIRVNDVLIINSGLTIQGRKTNFRINNPNVNKELFSVTTAERIECNNIIISPINSGLSPTSFKFTTVNSDSVFDSVSFKNFNNTSGLFLDNVDGFVLRNCNFLVEPPALQLAM